MAHGISGNIQDWWKQRVVLNDVSSSWLKVKKLRTPGSVFVPVLFFMYDNDIRWQDLLQIF